MKSQPAKRRPLIGNLNSVLGPEFNPMRAQFMEQQTEAAYQQYVMRAVVGRERVIAYGMITIYAFFGFFDYLVIKDNLEFVLTLRLLIVTPILYGMVLLTQEPHFKKWFQHITCLYIFTMAISIILMISALPTENPPPYLIGVIVVFIFAAAILHMPFLSATAMYATTLLVYVGVMVISDFHHSQVISGLFFMASAILLGMSTNYVQQIRARIIWQQRAQRDKDAKRIKELLVEATAADQTKSNFLSMMSHEMRTPLHQIIGYADIIKYNSAENANDSTDHAEQIRESAKILLSRIKKMLVYADANAGKLNYDAEMTDAYELVEATSDKLLELSKQHKVTIVYDNVAPKDLQIDFFHTSFALQNLLENAIVASSHGTDITITGTLDNESYVLTVMDHGVGMDADQLQLARAAFSQNESALTRSHEGLGLGLAVADKILRDQNATLSIQSQKGIGTTVTVTFKLEQNTISEEETYWAGASA